MITTKNEYVLNIDNIHYQVICTKVTKDKYGNPTEYQFQCPVLKNITTFTVAYLKDIDVITPVDNTEFFMMYTNWYNFEYGVHKDTVFATKLKQDIINTLKKRTHVKYGKGAWVEFDLNRLDKLIGDV